MAKISVIIPTKNRKELLIKTLQSVFDQSYKNIETIVIDDGSTDGTIDHCLKESRIRFVKNDSEIHGPSKARNIGIELSLGEFTLFLDDDDLLHPRHVEDIFRASKKLKKNQVASSPWRLFSIVEGKILFDTIMEFFGEKSFEKSVHDMINPVQKDNIINSSILWNNELIKDLKWNESLFTNGDLDFYLQALQKGVRFYGVSSGMVYYRSHSANRVAGKSSLRGIKSSSAHRFLWSKKLEGFKDNKLVSKAFRNSFMSLLLNWMDYPERNKYLSEMNSWFLFWGGKQYFLPHMPKSTLKRGILRFLFSLFGLRGVKIILGLKKYFAESNLRFEHSKTDEQIINTINSGRRD